MPRSRSIFIQSERVRRCSPARPHRAGRPDRAAGQQQVLGQGGLAGVGMADDGEGAPARGLGGGRMVAMDAASPGPG